MSTNDLATFRACLLAPAFLIVVAFCVDAHNAGDLASVAVGVAANILLLSVIGLGVNRNGNDRSPARPL